MFTHHDLQPDNLILDDKDQLWVIDFGQAGFYPEPFEYVATYSSWTGYRHYKSQISGLGTTLVSTVVAGFYRSYYRTMYWAIRWAVNWGRFIKAA